MRWELGLLSVYLPASLRNLFLQNQGLLIWDRCKQLIEKLTRCLKKPGFVVTISTATGDPKGLKFPCSCERVCAAPLGKIPWGKNSCSFISVRQMHEALYQLNKEAMRDEKDISSATVATKWGGRTDSGCILYQANLSVSPCINKKRLQNYLFFLPSSFFTPILSF